MKSQKDTYKSIIVSYENDSFSCSYKKQKFRDLNKNEVLVNDSYMLMNVMYKQYKISALH